MMSLKLSWSQESYGLKEFAEFYKYQLPVIIKVTQGYCGIDESKYTFSMDEVRLFICIKFVDTNVVINVNVM